jgi:serine/threonine protein phosphatase PrpC
LDFTKDNPALQELLLGKILHALNERQSRAVESDAPYAVGSSKGWVRNANEDAGLVARLRFVGTRGRDLDIAIVCDGMGGMQHGRLAAQLALSVFVSRFLTQASIDPLKRRVERALLSAQQAVYDRVQGDGGTTLTAVCVEGTRTCIAHVGDSRAYEVDERGRLTQITRDDTIGAALNRAEGDQGDFNRLIQYVGMPGGSDEGAFEPQILEMGGSLTRAGFVLVTDGVHGIGKDSMDRVASHSPSGFETIRRLISVADGFGGLDNATGIFLPADPFKGDDDSYGITLSLHSPSGIRQIWFGPSEGPTQHARAPRETVPPIPEQQLYRPPANRVTIQPPAAPPSKASSPRKAASKAPTRTKKAGRSKGKSGPDSPAKSSLEAHPRLEVFFPEEDDGGDQ